VSQVVPPSATTFKAQYVEFSALSDAVCNAFLADCALEFDATLFPGAEGTSAVMLAAARSIALSPAGRDMQLVSKDGGTPYDDRVKAAKRRATLGFRCP
jgi:hypothetical protein